MKNKIQNTSDQETPLLHPLIDEQDSEGCKSQTGKLEKPGAIQVILNGKYWTTLHGSQSKRVSYI